MKKDKAIQIGMSSLIWGIAAHGMALFNKYSFHDDVCNFNSVGATFQSGRWMLGILSIFIRRITGSNHHSTPLVCGLLTIIFIAIMAYLLSELLRIDSRILNILFPGILVSFPAITGIMGYMYTAPYYYFGTLLGVIGAYVFARHEGIVGGGDLLGFNGMLGWRLSVEYTCVCQRIAINSN